MNCPVDGATLEMSERQGVEIDYCPTCRGVWLDRGELDKILERSETWTPPPSRGDDRYDRDDDRQERRDDDRSRGDDRSYQKKKRRSFLSELFEGD